MDILRKELNAIYAAQRLEAENLPQSAVGEVRRLAEAVVKVRSGCAVITDASCDRCYIFPGKFGQLMGLADAEQPVIEVNSSDEDEIYGLIHPEDLVDKRFLEYEFFRQTDRLDSQAKPGRKAVCRLRMRDKYGAYRYVDNSTQIVGLSPAGKIWLILCLYDISPYQDTDHGIDPRIVDNVRGAVTKLTFDTRRRHVLSDREKEILKLIRDGRPSKQIADMLGISIHTVNRHRQNIIAKLSVGNSIEAVTAAVAMKLL